MNEDKRRKEICNIFVDKKKPVKMRFFKYKRKP